MLSNQNSIQISGSSTPSNELLLSHSTKFAQPNTSTAPFLGKTTAIFPFGPIRGERIFKSFMMFLGILSYIVT